VSYRNVFGEERIQVPLFETGNATIDAILADWFFGASGSQGFVDLAASIAGVEANQAAIQLIRNLAASGSGSATASADLQKLVDLAASIAGATAIAAEGNVYRDLAGEILGETPSDIEIGIDRELAGAAEAGAQFGAELTTEQGGHEDPVKTIYVSSGLPPLDRPFVGEEDALIWADDEEVLMML